jgi:hypothetical protein
MGRALLRRIADFSPSWIEAAKSATGFLDPGAFELRDLTSPITDQCVSQSSRLKPGRKTLRRTSHSSGECRTERARRQEANRQGDFADAPCSAAQLTLAKAILQCSRYSMGPVPTILRNLRQVLTVRHRRAALGRKPSSHALRPRASLKVRAPLLDRRGLFDGVFIAPTGMCGRQHIDHGRLRLFQFRDGETRGAIGKLAWLFFGRHRRRLLRPSPNVACTQTITRNPRSSRSALLAREPAVFDDRGHYHALCRSAATSLVVDTP